MKHILVFGSLRQHSKRGYNFDRFGKGSQKFVKNVTLNGYDMFDLGAYPAIAEGKGTIKAELHTVTDEAFARIQRMEAGAGYGEKTEKIDGVEATIFTMTPAQLQAYRAPKPYPSGDWN